MQITNGISPVSIIMSLNPSKPYAVLIEMTAYRITILASTDTGEGFNVVASLAS